MVWGCIVAALALIVYLLRDEFEPTNSQLEILASLAVAVLILFLTYKMARWFVLGPALARYKRACEADDWQIADQCCSELEQHFQNSPGMLLYLKEQRASALMALQKYAEAKSCLELIQQVPVSQAKLPWILNNLAWCELELKQPNRAVQTALAALAAAEKSHYPNIRYCKGTLGAAYVLAEQPEKGIPYLQDALGLGGGYHGQPLLSRALTAEQLSSAVRFAGGHNRAQSIRAFFLGQALEKIGQVEEAKEAYEFALHVYPNGEHGKLAQEKLGRLSMPT